MYKMKADGVVFYDPSSDDMTLQVLSPKAKYELNKSGSLTFTLLPGNVAYNSLHKLKTVVTLEQDGEIIFRGRVLETTSDLYNQKKVYCEGELAFLLDSLVRPYEFKGKAADLFKQLVTKHNEQVEDYKRFEVGIITAVTDEDDLETEGDGYADTLSEMQSLLLDGFGGYLRVRLDNGTRYLDYVEAFDQTSAQEINFGVNLVDIESKLNAQDVCTVLVPLGYQEGDSQTTIESVNGGKDYIEDAEAIAQYGRIIKTHTWSEVEDPEELLKLAQEYMAVMNAEKTLTITAVALQGIRLGDTVKLLSVPHGLDKEDVCTAIALDIENPEKSDYTFGFPLETLTESNARTIKGLSRSINDQHRWLKETDEGLTVAVKDLELIGHRVAESEVKISSHEISLKTVTESVDILGANYEEVSLRLSSAEGLIEAKADLVRVEALETTITGLVKTEDLEAETLKVLESARIADLKALAFNCSGTATMGGIYTEGAVITNLNAPNIITQGIDLSGSLTINGSTMYKTSLTVVTGIDVVTSLEGRITSVEPITTQFYYYA